MQTFHRFTKKEINVYISQWLAGIIDGHGHANERAKPYYDDDEDDYDHNNDHCC